MNKIKNNIQIVSHSSEPFRDRIEAGRLLGQALSDFKGKGTVVLGIPRGGVIVAREVSEELNSQLDIILSRKLRTPGQPELALGSVTEEGHVFLNEMLVSELRISDQYIQQEKNIQLAEIKRRSDSFRRFLPKVPISGKTAIIVDDGLATGATTEAAIWAIRQSNPSMLIAAMPVGSEETIERLAPKVDKMLCLKAPPFFMAVGQFYTRFEQIEDYDIVSILEKERQRQESKSVGGTS